MQKSSDSPGVVVFPPVLFAVTMVLGLLLHWLKPVHPFPVWPSRATGILLFVASVLIARSAQAAMRRAGTNVRPDQPALAIVTDGPFGFSRNPLYLATIGLCVSVALLVDALWPLVLLVPMTAILQWGVVAREERYLAAKFGEPYLAYRSRVRRWL